MVISMYCRCGFYGNPIYMGYCSKCYKELVRDVSLTSSTSESLKEPDEEIGMLFCQILTKRVWMVRMGLHNI